MAIWRRWLHLCKLKIPVSTRSERAPLNEATHKTAKVKDVIILPIMFGSRCNIF
ncbi:hypothetical protein KEJ25_02340 [Candidatus Bathyarchaeota archaeon]|nr:hypothetical protein [Candidatus Bathyarchaeota archaeon]